MTTIQVIGGDLYEIAARYLGDATQWIRIAQINGLSDPWLSGQQLTLTIPSVDPNAGGGIAPQ